jgi:hypothetical protein
MRAHLIAPILFVVSSFGTAALAQSRAAGPSAMRVAREPVVRDHVAREHVAREPVVHEHMAREPIARERAAHEPVARERAAHEPVARPAAVRVERSAARVVAPRPSQAAGPLPLDARRRIACEPGSAGCTAPRAEVPAKKAP